MDDAPAVAEVVAATELVDTGEADITTEEIVSQWQAMNHAEESVVVTSPEGRIVAAADILNRAYVSVSVYGFVHPDYQGLGIGQALIYWGETWARDRMDRAPQDARVSVQHFRHSSNKPFRQLLERSGYPPVRSTFTMEIDLAEPPPAPDWPAGITVRTFGPGQDERALHDAHEDAFRDVWGRPQNTLEQFVARSRVDAFDPDLWFIAEDQGEIAGMCLSIVYSRQAIIDTVGVRRGWRNQGLGLALLRHAFGVYHQRGIPGAWLSVDAESLTGAPRLYERAGMHVANTYVLHQKELRAGVDLGQRASEDE